MHITREYHQLYVLCLDQLKKMGFISRTRVSTSRPVVEGQARIFAPLLADHMIGDNTDNVHMQGTGLAAVNQVDKTMVKFGHHNQRARPVRGVDNLPVHLEFFGHGCEFLVQRRAIQLILRAQSDTHEKHATVGVAELLALVNIQPRLGKNLRYGGDNSKAISTRKGDDKFRQRDNPIRFRCDKRNFR